jgi:phosphatidylserine/phosphatidylglycerophosphate/cardiolipin synthase-like enzyme
MKRRPHLAVRFCAALLAVSFLNSPVAAMRIAVTAPKAAPTVAVPGAAGAGLGRLTAINAANLNLPAPNLLSQLPLLPVSAAPSQLGTTLAPARAVTSQPTAVESHAQAAVQGRSNREGLSGALQALGQEQRAAAKRPGMAALGSAAAAPNADAASGTQHAQAAALFNQKAGFAHQDLPVGLEDAMFEAFSDTTGDSSFNPLAASNRRRSPRGADLSDPIYPARKIRFHGAVLPSVAFRPDRSIEESLIDAIDASEKTIDIALYEFKNAEILKALRRAKARGVKVKVLIDFHHAYPTKRDDSAYWPMRSLEIQSLISSGFDIRIIKGAWKWGIMHNKVAIFDGRLGWFGSYNVSYTSERNHFENVVFTTVKKRVLGLKKLYKYLDERSVTFEEAKTHTWPEDVPAPPKDTRPSVGFNRVKFPSYVFTPDPEAEDLIIKAIETAKESVDMSMFTFASERIARALVKAKQDGKKVRVVVDKTQSAQNFMEPFVEWLAFHNIEIKTLAGPNEDGSEWAEKNHNKFIILDGKLVATGSMNYTHSAFNTGFENVFFLNEKEDAASFVMYFNDLFRHTRAERVVAPPQEPTMPTGEEIVAELRGPPAPLPAAPTWPELPARGAVKFHKETFPAAAVRPHDPVQDLLIKAIENSEKTIRLALYEFNLHEVLSALQRAKKRGVKIEIIADYSHIYPQGLNSKGRERTMSDEYRTLIDEGFEISVLRGVKSSGIMHHKFAIFDGLMVNFGSYNWAHTAEYNHFESVMFETEKRRVAFYEKSWDWMREQSVGYKEAPKHPWNRDWKRRRKAGDETPHVEPDIDLNGEMFPHSSMSPQGMVEDTLIRAIRAAKSSIDIAMFSFYSARIAEELLRAKERGIEVTLVLDRMQSKLMKLDNWFAYYGFDVKILTGPDPYGNVFWEKNHNKFMLIDKKFLALGSYNYTGNAEENSYENVNYYVEKTRIAFFNAYFALLHATGWPAWKPDAPPEGLPTPAEFFDPSRFSPEAFEY